MACWARLWLSTASAQAVDVEGRGGLGAAAVDGRHARQVHVLGLGVDNVAKRDMADILAFDSGVGQRFTHHRRGQLGGRAVLEAAAKGTNGGAYTADNNDFTGHEVLLGVKISGFGGPEFKCKKCFQPNCFRRMKL